MLPSPPTTGEPRELAEKHSLEEFNLAQEAPINVPGFTLLRCTIEGLARDGKKMTKEELFGALEERYPWLTTDEGLEYQVRGYTYLF